MPFKTLPMLCLAVALAGCATREIPAHQRPHSREYWEGRIAKVQPGMRRAQVEALLPVRSAEQNEVVPGGLTWRYAVDSAWQVEADYDSNGFPGFDEKKNPHLLRNLPANRLLRPVKLIRKHTKIDWRYYPQG